MVDAHELRDEAKVQLETAIGEERGHWSNVGQIADELIRVTKACGALAMLGVVRHTRTEVYFDDPDHLEYALKKAE